MFLLFKTNFKFSFFFLHKAIFGSQQYTIYTWLIDRLQVVPPTQSSGLKQDLVNEPREVWARFIPVLPSDSLSTRLFAAAFVRHIFSSPALSHSRFASNLSNVSLAIAFPVFVCLFSCFVLLYVFFFKHCIELFTDLTNPYFGQDTVRTAFCFRVLYLLSATLYCLAVILLFTGDADSVIHLLFFSYLQKFTHAWCGFRTNPAYGKRWRLYILPRYLANLTEPLAHIKSHILVKFIPVVTKSCMQGLKFSDLFCAFFMSGFRIFVR